MVDPREFVERALVVRRYKGEPFKCWQKAKELRLKVYRDYAEAGDKGGLRVAGGSWSFLPIAAGLGDDVYWLTSEPYSAGTAHEKGFSTRCMQASESRGWAQDLCGYVRNYLGCILTNSFTYGGSWPKPDILLQSHICCTHAKWFQAVRELEGGDVPYYCIDVSVGPYRVTPGGEKPKQHKLDYLTGQILDVIDQLDDLAKKRWGRRFDDEKFIEAVHRDCEATSLWAEICCLNQAVPAPMDEKSMFAFFNLAGIARHRKDVTGFYEELRDELKDRVSRGVAAVPGERCRVFSDSPPPWGFLDLYRYLEEYGCVSVGSYYTYGIFGVWEEDAGGNVLPRRTPRRLGMEIRTREDAARVMADWYLSKMMWQHLYGPEPKGRGMVKIARQWRCDGALIHYNRGCEMHTLSSPEVRLALGEAGIPVMTYESNMADERDFDEVRVHTAVDTFMLSLGFKKIGG
ncbi:MAG: benzoyl-CoA reductase, bzd-type, subunit O [Actinobacteria bacterium]|nr:benzoyl-CoA reductase, bzd-type, subunit O [Actinomycetota bacterium]